MKGEEQSKDNVRPVSPLGLTGLHSGVDNGSAANVAGALPCHRRLQEGPSSPFELRCGSRWAGGVGEKKKGSFPGGRELSAKLTEGRLQLGEQLFALFVVFFLGDVASFELFLERTEVGFQRCKLLLGLLLSLDNVDDAVAAFQPP